MKIWIYTICYNEMRILPWVIDYWEQYADHVVVYDNMSTDGSKEYLMEYDWIEVRDLDTHGKFCDSVNRDIKNTVWKECRNKGVDFVQVCDLDEVLYANGDNTVKGILADL